LATLYFRLKRLASGREVAVGAISVSRRAAAGGAGGSLLKHLQAHLSAVLCDLLLATSVLAATNEVSEPFQGVRLIHSVSTVPRLIDMFIVEVDMTSPGLSFLVSPSNGVLPGDNTPQTTRDFVTQVGAQIGINGAFYDFSTGGQLEALGLAVSNGDIYSGFESTFRDALNISQDNIATIIHSTGRGGPAHTPDVPLYNAVCGNTLLVSGGVNVAITTNTAIHPRTAVGVKPDGKLLIFTVDGRVPAHSNGLTYVEMANILLRWGVRDAINLDGGTSTTLVMDNPLTLPNDPAVINVPSDGFESAVTNNFAVFAVPRTAPGESRYVFADFEQGDEGSFNTAPAAIGAVANLSSADPVSGQAFDGQWSQRLTIVDDPAAGDDVNNPGGAWFARDLSGLGDPANNVSRPSIGSLGLWAKTSSDGLRISPLLDEPSGLASERGIPLQLIADGQWHPYFWELTNSNQWQSGPGGDGIVANTFTLDSIQVFGPPSASANRDAIVYLDSISQIIPGAVPEPASWLLLCATFAGALMARSRGRSS
jgi:hypothetical protein